MFDNIQPEELDVAVSEPAPEDIRSPVTVEHEAQTQAREQEALESLDPIYVHRNDYAQIQIEKVNAIFDMALALQEDADVGTNDQVSYMQDVIHQDVEQTLSEETLETLLTISEEQLFMGRDVARNAVNEVMSEDIAVDDVPAAREEAEERISRSMGSARMQEALSEIVNHIITANYIYDDEATTQRQEEVLDEVEPALIREGELLVQEGEIVSHETYDQISATGLLDEDSSWYPYMGLFMFVVIMVAMTALYAEQSSTPLRYSNRTLLLYVIVFFITLATMKLVSVLQLLEIDGILWVTPIALGTMLLAHLLAYRVAIFSSVLFALAGSVIFNDAAAGTFHATFLSYALFSGLAGAFFIGKIPRISKVLQSGGFIAILNAATVTAFHFFSSSQFEASSYGLEVSFALGSGVLAAVLTLGLVPFFETGFNILTPTKLIELSNANHPLLRKVLLEAPGTYHHSVMVGNLSEAACEAIGANGLLARVSSYYHDLGKTKHPLYFIENQLQTENPHDRLSPEVSKRIIIDHPYDGAKILQDHNMPKEIIDVAKEHHGTTLLKYFYHKAKEQGMEPKEEDYRYPGPKAQFKESAVIGIADGVEAAVRSMGAPTADKIEKLVNHIIRERLIDGQFDECDITLKELSIAAGTMCETLQGTFHSRIEYPDDEDEKEKDSI
nr:HD family phosphohydrolase [Geomicrobium halophilum]